MSEKKEIPFPELLEKILFAEKMPISLLYQLSDLDKEKIALLQSRWEESNPERRQSIVRHMADLTEDNFVLEFKEMFAYCLQDAHAPVRVAALDGLWDSTDLRLVQPILKIAGEDRDETVRAAAVRALAHFVLLGEWDQLPPGKVAPLVTDLLALYDQPEAPYSVKRAVLEAVSPTGNARVIDMIEDAYEMNDPDFQLSAIFAMGSSADERWLPTILTEMENIDPLFRAEAARAAGEIGSLDAASELVNLTTDEALDVALAAIHSLGQIGGDLATQILDEILENEEFEALHEAAVEAIEEMSLLSFSGEPPAWDKILPLDADEA